VRPGLQTSEFWLSALALLSTVLPQVFGLFGGPESPVVVASTAALAAVYTGARSYVKAKEAQAARPAPGASEKAAADVAAGKLPEFLSGPPSAGLPGGR